MEGRLSGSRATCIMGCIKRSTVVGSDWKLVGNWKYGVLSRWEVLYMNCSNLTIDSICHPHPVVCLPLIIICLFMPSGFLTRLHSASRVAPLDCFRRTNGPPPARRLGMNHVWLPYTRRSLSSKSSEASSSITAKQFILDRT